VHLHVDTVMALYVLSGYKEILSKESKVWLP
jgi:hypothetical protein